MDDNKRGVSSTLPPVDESASNEGVEETTPQTAPESSTTPPATPTPEGVSEEGEVDEKGVPFKNRFMETKRKLEDLGSKYRELEARLPKMLEEAVTKAVPQTQEAQTYTKEQLIHIKNATDNPQDRAWAELELEKLRTREVKEMFEKTRAEERREQTITQQKQMALQEVYTKYPLVFNTDGTWNNAHPLTQKIAQIYNSTPELQTSGRGLSAAADIAFAEWIRTQQPQVVARNAKLKREVKKLQTQTLIEGSGQQTTTVPPTKYSVAMEKLVKTGDKKVLKDVAAQILKDVHPGLIKE